MLLIYTPRLTNRLGYTLEVLLRCVLKVDYNITTNEDFFLRHGDAKLCYGPRRLGDAPFLRSSKLLFQTTIDEQNPLPFCRDGQWMLFPVYGNGADLPFDPLAATFYMVSRYEEYLAHRADQHGRFCAEGSVASQAGFLDQPVVEQWAMMLRNLLQERYPDVSIEAPRYRFVQTVDIDAAWRFRHKGLVLGAAGLLRDLFVRHAPHDVVKRLRVLAGREPDPYDTFDYIIAHHRHSPRVHLIFFALVSDYGRYDKPASYQGSYTRQLLQHLGDHAKVGLHPSYYCVEDPPLLDRELHRLESILHRNIVRLRYHYLRLSLPQSYRMAIHAGLRHDYSMGYPDAVGFRAGISRPYPFYDLEADQETEFTIHPFCVMDTTLNTHLGMQPDEALQCYKDLIDRVKAVGGTFTCIVHNSNLCEEGSWEGWCDVYEWMVYYAQP